MQRIASRHPIWTGILAILVAGLLRLILAPWPDGLEDSIGRNRVFPNAVFRGITLGALHFLVAAGFTLTFGLMRNVNLAHGSLYLPQGRPGFEVSEATGSWLLAFPVVFVVIVLPGLILQHQVFRRMEGEELRQTMVAIGLSVVLADIMLWIWGGQSCTFLTPDLLSGPPELPAISSGREDTGAVTWFKFAAVRIAILIAAIVIGAAVWLVLHRSRLGMLIRAGVDDRERLAASGCSVNSHRIAALTFASAISAVGGILPVWRNAQISPGTAGFPAGIDIPVIAVVGGIRRPIGPFIGAPICVVLRSFSPDVLTALGLSGEQFKRLIGTGFLPVVLFSPAGIPGLWEKWQARKRRDPLKGPR